VSFYPINWKEIQIIGNKFHVSKRTDTAFTSMGKIKMLTSRDLGVCGPGEAFYGMWGLRIAWLLGVGT
jgi:hypothetical protein